MCTSCGSFPVAGRIVAMAGVEDLHTSTMSSCPSLLPESLITLQDGSFLSKMMVRLYQSPHNSTLKTQLVSVLHSKHGALDVSERHLEHLLSLLELVVYSNDLERIPEKFGNISQGTTLRGALEHIVGTLREQDSNVIKIPYMKRVIGLGGTSVLREQQMRESGAQLVWRGTWHCVDGEHVSMEMDRATIETVLKGMQKIKNQLKLIS
mmetsp:Transcript_5909/g.22421  ORF Transcript_5909/g.22421 Transcript_5909/m.22421 type:complete len:208 (-) Transcript_5909:31-654(-)